jgi:putative restriction endonuclease
MKAYVAVTDNDWYRFLSSRPTIHEANFWRPYGSRLFKVLAPGEPFIFKTKAPTNKIVGGAIYEGFVSLPISRAWEFFGEGNGVATPEALIQRIHNITDESIHDIGDREIGCVLLRDLCFFPTEEQLPVPRSFSANIVQGKSFTFPGEDVIVDTATNRILNNDVLPNANDETNENLGPTQGSPRLVRPRLGQGGGSPGSVCATVRSHSPQDLADASGSTHSPGLRRRPAPHRQWNTLTLRRAHHVRSRLYRRRSRISA